MSVFSDKAKQQHAHDSQQRERTQQKEDARLTTIEEVEAIEVPTTKYQILCTINQLLPTITSLQWMQMKEKVDTGEVMLNQFSYAMYYKFLALKKALRSVSPNHDALASLDELERMLFRKIVQDSDMKDFIFSSDERELYEQIKLLYEVLRKRGWEFGRSEKYNGKTQQLLSQFKKGIQEYYTKFGYAPLMREYASFSERFYFIGLLKKQIVRFLMLAGLLGFWGYTQFMAMSTVVQILTVVIALTAFPFYITWRRKKKQQVLFEIAAFEAQKAKKVNHSSMDTSAESPVKPSIEEKLEDLASDAGGNENECYVNLNKENRIDNRLSEIWNRYTSVITEDFMFRKPVYNEHGKNDTILFVSLNPTDEELSGLELLRSPSGKNLSYPFYDHQPLINDFIEKQRQFAMNLFLTCCHINLLYAHENDRNKLVQSNSDFIREQLELTYESIRMMKPKMIVFLSDYCRTLVYGTDRWTRPSKKGIYDVLHGTEIPVIFTDDITNVSPDVLEKIQQEVSCLLEK